MRFSDTAKLHRVALRAVQVLLLKLNTLRQHEGVQDGTLVAGCRLWLDDLAARFPFARMQSRVPGFLGLPGPNGGNMAGQSQRYHLGAGEFTTHLRLDFSGWIGMFTGGTGFLTHGHMFSSEEVKRRGS